ncbi:TlpA disulfide reductase family protein [Chryseobacterium sp. BIGb0232]|uniref:TlpA family protein disulfide reductase n=1 Tax=Chryseobacterium sp. BIGb0232 TaxID=2940598 RepID=UPI000F4824C7|nr:TlpA disulfide reductase family protein [Chryseobacterium sp. BIGb0232]MCS4303907.1 thiol-disulfide isomerase/thioredoxin [Chryseobacterium sp. BIGb0232]ROS11555.1 thiol-disulfide isomerase/thioredoxin [Chryseobacterium nakagawai]
MKKYLLLFIIAIFVMSCSKKVEVKGKITGSSPLERIEFVEASGVGTLPLINIGLDKDGNFSGSFEAPKDGMYVINYANKQNLIYLEGGQKVNISGNAMTFPNEYVITGDAKKNNDFLAATQKFLGEYGNKVDLRGLMAGDENGFVKGMQKVEADINKSVDDLAAKNNPSKALLAWKKNDVKVTVLNLLANYEMSHGVMAGNPGYKPSKALTDYEAKLDNDKEAMVKSIPLYRQYLLVKMTPDFQKYAEANSKTKPAITTSEMFAKYLNTKKDLSQTAKDYLLAFVMAQTDIHPTSTTANLDKIKKLIDTDIKDATIKSDLLKMQMAITGLKIGEVAPEAALVKQDGKAYKLSENKGKPYMLFFYASWNPYIGEATVPVLKEVVNFYKSKMNFVFVNVDDTKDQFIKTSNSLLKGIQGVNVYGEKGMESDIAKKYGVYGFKLPCFVIIDKDGKIASRSFVNLGEQELVTILDKLTGLSAPKVDPNAQQMQPQLQIDPTAPQPANPQPAPTK